MLSGHFLRLKKVFVSTKGDIYGIPAGEQDAGQLLSWKLSVVGGVEMRDRVLVWLRPKSGSIGTRRAYSNQGPS